MCRLSVGLAAVVLGGQVVAVSPASASEAPTVVDLPLGPTPLGNPGDWITTEDYPATALKDTRTGRVRFRLNVDITGIVTGCMVIVSSGSADLDLMTCDLITKRARFAPARDAGGHPQPGAYSTSVDWVIPKVPPPKPYRIVSRFVVEPDGTLTHCELTDVEGDAKQLRKVGNSPCYPLSFSDGYVDAAGKPVRRQVIYTTTITVQDMPETSPAH